MGRVTQSVQNTLSVPYQFDYTYNDLSLETELYPSRTRKVEYCHDAAGRIQELKNLSGAALPSYASGITYGAHGGMTQMMLGNGAVETRNYSDQRQQLTGVTLARGGSTLLSLGYGYCPGSGANCTTNNGNVLSQTIGRPNGNWTETYGYDLANRLTSAGETGTGSWSQAYGYDVAGNRWVPPGM
jgi:uncharacterized protein RhaS with RHS repeats